MQLALVEPDLEACRPTAIANATSDLGILGGVTQKDGLVAHARQRLCSVILCFFGSLHCVVRECKFCHDSDNVAQYRPVARQNDRARHAKCAYRGRVELLVTQIRWHAKRAFLVGYLIVNVTPNDGRRCRIGTSWARLSGPAEKEKSAFPYS